MLRSIITTKRNVREERSRCCNARNEANAYCVLLMQIVLIKSIKINTHFCRRHQFLSFKLYSPIFIQDLIILRPLSQATASNRPIVFISTVTLPDGRADEAWEPSHKTMPFSLPTVKCRRSSHDMPLSHTLLLYFQYIYIYIYIYIYLPLKEESPLSENLAIKQPVT
jgi:hypothetical protein